MPNERDPDTHSTNTTGGEVVGSSDAAQGSAGEARPKRRRGNRGGKGRSRSHAGGQKPLRNDVEPDLPDLPWEGSPQGSGRSSGERSESEGSAIVSGRSSGERSESEGSAIVSGRSSGEQQRQDPRPRQRRGQTKRQDQTADLLAADEAVVAPNLQVGDAGKSVADPKVGQAKGGESKTSDGKKSPERSANRNRNRRSGPRDRGRRPVIRAEYTMCVHVQPNVTQIAVLEGRTLIEHYVSHAEDDDGQIHGNIYMGRVQNVLPGMEAAFVDIATPKNAVLYRGDVQFDRNDLDAPQDGKEVRIEELLKNGQLVICQVTKNPIGTKGARLTQDVSIAGRFVVLVPNSSTYGISKRLPDDERKRLRGVLDEVKPAHHGIIVRTAASGADAEELRRDVQMLVAEWDRIAAKAAKLRGPALLHREPNLAVRIIREEFSENYQQVIIDDREVFDEVRRYVESITPDLADRIVFFDRGEEPLPVFEQFHVHEQLHKAIDRKVWLPSGGSIIIERTEALTVIDVNTGKNVGSTSLEETVFRNNLEAATEIARQLRLRDIGGIIVIDFIDMEIKPNRAAVVSHFRDELSRDKTRTQVFEISDLGLVEMTRKRISEGLIEALSDVCPTCQGRGFVFDPSVLVE
jgi:ribonuclease E